ncbi:outer membrane protein [Bartonella taylorii]|uniref:outer membrane protein n=1 Tax=Bartonella taylorii TaxID=33046 RepID=UPI001ABA4D44|nr:outer membrane beta-barrel protein [Bartonella taylorii]
MNTKCLIAISVAILMTSSTVCAARSGIYPVRASVSDVYPVQTVENGIYPVRTAESGVYPASRSGYSQVVISQPFSWTGLYLGGQIGGFSSTSALTYSQDLNTGKWPWIDKDLSPKPSGFIVGLYGGSNIAIGNDFILSIDTDAVFSGRQDTKTDNGKKIRNADELGSINTTFEKAGIQIKKPDSPDETILDIGHQLVSSITLKETWAGAMRVRFGLASDYIMPYVSGGIAYAQMQYIVSLLAKSEEDPSTILASGNVFDKTKIMVGFTAGCGIDFGVTESLILRAEYRYSDFGKKVFEKDKLEIGYKTNDFRIGFAYKF